MKLKLLILSVFLLLFFNPIHAQEASSKYFGIDAGMDFIGCKAPEKDYIRAESFSYMENDATDNLKGLLYKSYFGVKAEFQTKNGKFGILSGIRYNRLNGSIGKDQYWYNSPEFFYLTFYQDASTTEYLKVKEINQKSDYIGIPLELRIYPFNKKKVRIFFKAAAEFNFLMKTNTDVVFINDEMEVYEDDVAKIVGDPQSFYSLFYLSAGLKIGNNSKPGFSLEACLPSFFLTPDALEMLDPTVGIGFQLNFQLPF
jgi:hypothetical protein